MLWKEHRVLMPYESVAVDAGTGGTSLIMIGAKRGPQITQLSQWARVHVAGR